MEHLEKKNKARYTVQSTYRVNVGNFVKRVGFPEDRSPYALLMLAEATSGEEKAMLGSQDAACGWRNAGSILARRSRPPLRQAPALPAPGANRGTGKARPLPPHLANVYVTVGGGNKRRAGSAHDSGA